MEVMMGIAVAIGKGAGRAINLEAETTVVMEGLVGDAVGRAINRRITMEMKEIVGEGAGRATKTEMEGAVAAMIGSVITIAAAILRITIILTLPAMPIVTLILSDSHPELQVPRITCMRPLGIPPVPQVPVTQLQPVHLDEAVTLNIPPHPRRHCRPPRIGMLPVPQKPRSQNPPSP